MTTAKSLDVMTSAVVAAMKTALEQRDARVAALEAQLVAQGKLLEDVRGEVQFIMWARQQAEAEKE